MSDGMLDSFWSSLQRAEQRVEAGARDAARTVYRTVYGYESRVMRVRWALETSGPLARKEIAEKLEGISLDAIWDVLLSIVKDIALYYGGSVVLGTAVGAGVGAFFGGVGAVPGAALGFEAGMVLGDWVMAFLGLKMLAEGMIDTIPPAMNCYVEGFRAAWGPAESDRPDACYYAGYAPSKETAALRFAHGHVLMIMAILIAMVAYLTRGKSKEALFKAVGDSKRLGSKVADWLKENEGKLLKEESLQPKVRPRPEPPQETSQAKTEQVSSKQARGPSAKVSDSPSAPTSNTVVTRTAGKNTVSYTLDSEGNTISAKGSLAQDFGGGVRSSAEKAAQKAAADAGVAGDQGGHLVAYRFMPEQGEINLFPQDGNFNTSAFKTLENDYARYVNEGYQVDFEHTLGDFDPVTGRPGTVNADFTVRDSDGNVVDSFSQLFDNKANQVYVRRAY